MPLSWNEIKSRALAFSREWKDVSREEAEAKPFLTEFLNVFGINRKRVATFEHKVKKLDEADGYIDLLWKGMLLVEMKSRGKDLSRAYEQARNYCFGLQQYELPKLILVSDFNTFHLYDEDGKENIFFLKDLHAHVNLFASIAGYQKKVFKEQDPVNIHAAELMGKVHDQLKEIGYEGHPLELYLVRLLFCLFADDTGIFEANIFYDYIIQRTSVDGADLAMHLERVFYVLNTPHDKRLRNLDEQLNVFPYVNGKLFEETLPPASFDSRMRQQLLDCCALDWSKISPAIFGSLFQSVMNEKERRNLGAHYTSEKNILKVIRPLFLDELWAEFDKVKSDKRRLKKLHEKISSFRFLDPACGCGNFLIIAYRELRLLELEIIKTELHEQMVTSINDYFLLDVDRFYGIEYEEFPAHIAQVAMWLIDHQMNMQASEEFGEYYVRLPLRKSATIVQGNSLRINWQSLIVPLPWEKGEPKYDFIFGNPPFVGYAWQSAQQKEDMQNIYKFVEGSGVLDYVTAWYIKAVEYLGLFKKAESNGINTKVAFVSTNSITQGEQVGILWNELLNNYKIKIHFAHRTFKWNNEARGNAAVHVVIIGFSDYEVNDKFIYEYDDIKADPHKIKVKHINPYLVDAKDIFIKKRREPICSVPSISRGSDAIDDGNLLLTFTEKEQLIKQYPNAQKLIRPFLMGKEFLNNIPRFCIWLKNVPTTIIKEIPPIYERVERVKKFRSKSRRHQTLKAANYPYLFGEERQPESDYLAIPKVSSENRDYLPIGYCDRNIICGDKLFNMPNASLFHFGVLMSKMQNTWMRYTCGRLKSDFSYSNTIVYNNFPWPENPSDKQKELIEKAAQEVLDVRGKYLHPETEAEDGPDKGSSLADLYDPNTMPPDLVKAHQALDKAVDLCYRPQPFPNEARRMEFLFELYDHYTAGLFVKPKKTRKKDKL